MSVLFPTNPTVGQIQIIGGQPYIYSNGSWKKVNGGRMRAGTGAPTASIGTDGDVYYDYTNKLIYGPKAAGVWPGASTSLTSADGTVLAGTGAPTSGLGLNGDYYVDTAALKIYGPKAAGAWPGAGTSIGTALPANAVGALYNDGAGNLSYKTYNDGNTLTGSGAPTSLIGQNGDYYLDTATKYLYGPKAAGAWPGTYVSLAPQSGGNGVSISGGTSVVFAIAADTTHILYSGHIQQAAAGLDVYGQFSTDGGVTWISTGYHGWATTSDNLATAVGLGFSSASYTVCSAAGTILLSASNFASWAFTKALHTATYTAVTNAQGGGGIQLSARPTHFKITVSDGSAFQAPSTVAFTQLK